MKSQPHHIFGFVSFAVFAAIAVWTGSHFNELFKKSDKGSQMIQAFTFIGVLAVSWSVGWIAEQLWEVMSR
jgi:hypothetical protein